MPLPDRAWRVYYSIAVVDEVPEPTDVMVEIDVSLNQSHPAELDAAVQAGADAIVTALAASLPGRQVQAMRRYEALADGDPWPPTESEEG